MSHSTLCQKSWVFSGCSLPQGKLTGWVKLNTVKKVIIVVKDKIAIV
jgi:hypothetical protein